MDKGQWDREYEGGSKADEKRKQKESCRKFEEVQEYSREQEEEGINDREREADQMEKAHLKLDFPSYKIFSQHCPYEHTAAS